MTDEFVKIEEDDPVLPPWAVAALGELDATPPPSALRSRVMSRALAARASGRPAERAAIDGVEALGRAVTTLDQLVSNLEGGDWERAIGFYEDWTVRDLLAHLAVVDDYMVATLGLRVGADPADPEADHVEMCRPSIAELRSRPVADTIARWRESSSVLLSRLQALTAGGADLSLRFRFHGVESSLRSLLVVRTFELWTHAEDIRAAVDRPAESPDEPSLDLMTTLAVKTIPLGLLVGEADDAGRSARVVLTGPGGGTWHLSLGLDGAAPGDPDVTIVADAVAFCRLASKRLPAASLGAHVSGDPDLGQRVLVAAALFGA